MNKLEKNSVQTVAKKANVSIATVSRVLNHPYKVKEETRKKVLKIIDEMNYKPNAFARGLASRKPNLIALVVPDFTRASVAELVNGICNAAKENEYQIMFFLTENYNREYVNVWNDVLSSHVDGVIYLNDLYNKEDIEEIKKINVPVVVCNNIVELENVISVNIDYRQAAKDITNKLIKNGKKNILFATTTRLYSTNEEKEKGYREAIKEAGLEEMIFNTSGRTWINKIEIQDFIKNKPKIDAVIGVRDSITVSLMNALIDKKYSVPDDVEIYSMQNTKLSRLSRPQLSVVSSPIDEISVVAVNLLTVLMNKEEVKIQTHFVDYEIINRETTK